MTQHILDFGPNPRPDAGPRYVGPFNTPDEANTHALGCVRAHHTLNPEPWSWTTAPLTSPTDD